MDGIVIVNKPKGYTSHDIVSKVRKIYKEKVGHTGTLDPMATGVLPLLIGKGTLCSKYLVNHDKEYCVTLELGKKTDTADIEGKIIEECEVNKAIFDENNIKQVLKTFIGKQEQIPPIYSAIKVNGKKLYEYAREGINVEIKPRKIEIYNIKLLKINDDSKTINFIVSCSKGTYIRSLCEDIAKRLGTIGYMAALERQKVGEFNLEQAFSLEELEKERHIITIEELFNENPEIDLPKDRLKHFLNGVQLTFREKEDKAYRIYSNGKFIGIGVIKENKLKRDIII